MNPTRYALISAFLACLQIGCSSHAGEDAAQDLGDAEAKDEVDETVAEYPTEPRLPAFGSEGLCNPPDSLPTVCEWKQQYDDVVVGQITQIYWSRDPMRVEGSSVEGDAIEAASCAGFTRQALVVEILVTHTANQVIRAGETVSIHIGPSVWDSFNPLPLPSGDWFIDGPSPGHELSEGGWFGAGVVNAATSLGRAEPHWTNAGEAIFTMFRPNDSIFIDFRTGTCGPYVPGELIGSEVNRMFSALRSCPSGNGATLLATKPFETYSASCSD